MDSNLYVIQKKLEELIIDTIDRAELKVQDSGSKGVTRNDLNAICSLINGYHTVNTICRLSQEAKRSKAYDSSALSGY